ncbi:eukaryotic translation initiation factor 4E1 [Drosophila bipectinata]|uniref:eukaryotic translation initiation factor 4E1 n=1 Tax=Drosophila bipectinata TaxID=42026 RepID=UPI001C8AABFE|nr:eukaryotic translation initiation factor 4E1 [Drosophila bipectinata]
MVFTGYEGVGRQRPKDSEWLQCVKNPDWDQNLAKYGDEDLVATGEQELQPSLNRVVSLIDYDLSIKHPLEHTWTLWHWENDRHKSWSDMLSDVTSFNTVEDFFSVYYFIKPPSDLKIYNDYMVFKEGVRPMWEDDVNKEGGRWMMLLDKVSKTFMDKIWHDLLLCTIGECFDYSEQICGVVINVRHKANKLSLWTKDSRNVQAILSIGKQMKQMLPLGNLEIQYQVHKDAMVQHGPNVNAIYKL